MSEGPTIGDWTQYGWVPDNASSFPARIRLRDTAWMVYYEPDVTGLKAEVLMLRKENKELHELALTLAHCAAGHGCDMCPLNGKEGLVSALDMCDGIHDHMRELGVTA